MIYLECLLIIALQILLTILYIHNSCDPFGQRGIPLTAGSLLANGIALVQRLREHVRLHTSDMHIQFQTAWSHPVLNQGYH